MDAGQQKLNTSPSIFLRLIIGLPILAYLLVNWLTVDFYGAHGYYFYSFIYAALYYWDEPSKIMVINYMILAFSILFPFVFKIPKKEVQDRYGSAQEADDKIITKMFKQNKLDKEKGIILGKFTSSKNSKLIRFDRPLSTLILAPAGTGKTTSIAVPNVLGLDHHSLIIHDPKGELCEASYHHRNQFSECMIYNFAIDGCAKFNPFCKTMIPQDERLLRTYVDNIATTIFYSKNSSDEYWMAEASNIFRFFALYALYIDGETSLPDIYKATKQDRTLKQIIYKMMGLNERGKEEPPLKSKAEQQQSAAKSSDDNYSKYGSNEAESTNDFEEAHNALIEIRQRIEPYPILKELGNSILQICSSEKQLAGVLGSFNSKMSLFQDPIIEAATSGKNQLVIDDLRKSLYTVYIIVNDEDRERLQPIISLMLELMAKKLISKLPEDDDNRITFILDEFVRLKGINTLKTLPEIGRGYNLASIYIAQDYKQVESVFGREMTDILETLCAYKVVFKQNNRETAERTANLIGQYTDTKQSYSHSKNNPLDKGSVSSSLEGLKLITAQDILNLPDDECIIIVEGFAKYPIRAKTSNFFNTEPFKSLHEQRSIKDYRSLLGGQND